MPTFSLLKRMPRALVISSGAHLLFVFSAISLVDSHNEPVYQTTTRPGTALALELQAQPKAEEVPAHMPPTEHVMPSRDTQAQVDNEAPSPVQNPVSPRPAVPVETAEMPRHTSIPDATVRNKSSSLVAKSTGPSSVLPELAAAEAVSSPVKPEGEVQPKVQLRQKSADPEAIAEYQRAVQALLEENKHYPRQARLRRMEDEIVVSFTINEDGGLETCTLVSSAGFSVLDDAALAAVRNAAPFPAPPAGLADEDGKPFTFEVPILFSIRS